MSVRHKILALLSIAPCYGFQLRNEIQRRGLPSTRVNVGQIYSTLERLERDGLAFRGDTDAQGHVFYEVTTRGREVATEWIVRPVAFADTIEHLSFALSLPAVDGADLVRSQRGSLGDIAGFSAEAGAATAVLDLLVQEGLGGVHRAQTDWLERCAKLLEANPGVLAYGLGDDTPRRGRRPSPV